MYKLCTVHLRGTGWVQNEDVTVKVLTPTSYTDKDVVDSAINKAIEEDLGCFEGGCKAKHVKWHLLGENHGFLNNTEIENVMYIDHNIFKKALLEEELSKYEKWLDECYENISKYQKKIVDLRISIEADFD